MATKAQRDAAARYLAKKKTITIRLDPEEAGIYEAAAERAGKSVNAYFLEGVKAQMERDSANKYYIGIPKAAADQAGQKDGITGKEWLIETIKNALSEE